MDVLGAYDSINSSGKNYAFLQLAFGQKVVTSVCSSMQQAMG
jgi:hypothetical protein